jgi:hypothetical protein
MGKKGTLVLVGLLTFLLTLSVFGQVREVDAGKAIGIAVDGVIDAAYGGSVINISTSTVDDYEGYIESDQDASATVYLAWDDNRFYIALNSIDDQNATPGYDLSGAEEAYADDAAEIYFSKDYNNIMTDQNKPYFGDYSYQFIPVFKASAFDVWYGHETGGGATSSHQTVAISALSGAALNINSVTATNYIIEMSVDFSGPFLGISPTEGTEIAFNIGINDNDGSGAGIRDGILRWMYPDCWNNIGADVSWGKVILAATGSGDNNTGIFQRAVHLMPSTQSEIIGEYDIFGRKLDRATAAHWAGIRIFMTKDNLAKKAIILK